MDKLWFLSISLSSSFPQVVLHKGCEDGTFVSRLLSLRNNRFLRVWFKENENCVLRETNKKMNKEHFLYDGRVEENQRCEPEEAIGCCNSPCLKKCLGNADGALCFPLCCLNQPQSHVQKKLKLEEDLTHEFCFPSV